MASPLNAGPNDVFRKMIADILDGPSPLPDKAPVPPQSAAPAPPVATPARAPAEAVDAREKPRLPLEEFIPLAPMTCEQSGLSVNEIESLALKYLLNCGPTAGREIAEHLKLPFRLLEVAFRRLKDQLLVVYKSSAALSDYIYEPTVLGLDRARRLSEHLSYFGAAPVSLADYVASVAAQSVSRQRPRLSQLRKAFSDLVLGEEILRQIGQALNGGMGLFLSGSPGNGKTCIAERIVRTFGEAIWIPRTLSVFGEVIRLYDPSNHEPLPLKGLGETAESQIDKRWIRIRRPTLVVGGELTLEHLEIRTNVAPGVGEAPLQMKANGGSLVIDDFGRQRVSARDLLNRWIVPLEKRYDFLNLANGRKIQVPFDQLIVFSTNLEPRDLVDEAFLRRIPYKIDVTGPTEIQFRALFRQLCTQAGLEHREDVLDYLIEECYRKTGREMRFCHPRDLVRQAGIYCHFHELPPVLTRAAIDAAVRNYFVVMQ